MIEFRVSARDRKTLIIGGIAVLSLLVIGRGAPAWYRWRSNAAVSTRVVLVDASEATGSVSRSLEVDAAVRRAEVKRMEVSPAFINGSGVAAAAATLASVVSDAATTNGLRLGAVQASGDSAGVKSGGLVHLRVRGDATGDVTAVTRFLAALEGGVPLIAVREVSVTQGEPNASADRPESLHVEFSLEALAHLGPVEERP
ncbi:MAG TPA: GspMb/PilO family protein [Gemmatimonadaceae bacterium]|nr:GspMb/PilO family protein [Gemmatimonadaceae bacterium]